MKQKFYRKRKRRRSAFAQPVEDPSEHGVKGFYTDEEKRVRPLVEPLSRPTIPR